MFTVSPTARQKFLRQLDAAIGEVKSDFNQLYRGLVSATFNYVVRETPQWSGNAAANWNLDIGAPSFRTDSTLKDAVTAAARVYDSGWQSASRHQFGAPVASKGDPRAMAIAAARAESSVRSLVYTQSVFLNNAAEDLGKQYIQFLENNPGGYLRPENEPGHMVQRAVGIANGVLATISPPEQKILKRVTVGNWANGGVM